MTSRRLPPSRPSGPPTSSRPVDTTGRDNVSPLNFKRGRSKAQREQAAEGQSTGSVQDQLPTRSKPQSKSRTQRPHVPVAMAWGALSALGMSLLIAMPVFVAWAVDSKSSTSWNATLGVAIDLWALAHRAHVHASGTTVVFSPLALTLLCVLSARFGARLALPKQRLSGRDLRAVLGGFIGGYVLAAQFLGVVSSLGSSTINPLSLLIGPALVAALGVAWAAWHERRNSPEIAAFDEAVVSATPLLAQRSIRSAFRGLALLSLLMSVLFIGLVAWHGQRVWAVHSQLHTGFLGGLLLVFGQLLALPNLLALLAGWSAGAPVHIGDVIVGHSGMATGTLPMVPVLGAIPQSGMHSWSWILAVSPFVVGGFIGWDAAGTLTRLSSMRAKLLVALCAAGLATVLMWILWWFSTASVSTGLLTYVGPGWTAWLYLPFEFIVSAIVVAAIRHWILNHRPR